MFLMHVFCIYLLFIQVFFVVRTCASNAYASWTLASSCTSVFGRPYTYFQYMCFMDTCFSIQVFLVVRTHAFSTCASWTFAFRYKCFWSSVHMLSVYVLHGHLLFGTSVFGRPYTCFQCICFTDTSFLVQVFLVVRTQAFSTCASWTLHLLFSTSVYCRPYTCF